MSGEMAGDDKLRRMARSDVRRELDKLIEGPRGTHLGRATSDSIAYVAEVQRIRREAEERR